MIDQFFGKTFRIGLVVLLGFYLMALFGYFVGFEPYLLFVAGMFVLVVSLNRLEYGVYLAFLELFSNPHGQLISTQISGFQLSLRMVVFLTVMLVALIVFVRNTKNRPQLNGRFKMFIPLIVAVIVGFFVGFIQNNFALAFSDGNAYLYLLYLVPILMIRWDSDKQRELLQLLAAGAVWTILLSIVILYVFSHFNEVVLQTSYYFLRDLRIAEITNLGGGVYRVFMQTQFFVITFLFLLIAMFTQSKLPKRSQLFILALPIATMLVSLSRSFWVGIAVACFVFLGLLVVYVKPSVKSWGKIFIGILTSSLLAVVLLTAIVLFPIPQQSTSGADLAEALSKRTTETDDVAISSRWNLLDPMFASITSHVFEGSGFGASVTFESDDPRVREISEDGTWTVVAMEWGWLEQWLKMGILAPIGLVALFALITKRLLAYVWTDRLWLGVGLISSLAFLAVTHFFSPYLNHPIGLGMILFVIPFLPQTKKAEAVEATPQALLLKNDQVGVVATKTN